MIKKLSRLMRQFMRGRYGTDSFSNFLMIIATVMMLCAFLSRSFAASLTFEIIMAVSIGYCLFRMMSKNRSKRYGENLVYRKHKTMIVNRFERLCENQRKWWKNLTTDKDADNPYLICKCRGCRQKVRVPKGRGRIRIRCPKCGREFIKRT